ncbi:cytochrome b-c1 complex subunit 7 [Hyalella azteca]|uniref:Cytochrome b-c1 complex subunit 7 n=1 Tax=Hyalella azteca TaxID=294128 RepID=A0A8B7P442_HYAAZ|nr:cytochrome b-c1 complex subunit 7 [Hyalella azteca]
MAVAAKASVMTLSPVREQLRRWAFKLSGYNRYGLYLHDLYQETPDVSEAIRRLPAEKQDERLWRLQRAIQLDLTKRVLPKEEWHTYEEEISKGRYLTELLKQVEFERKEKEEWESK